MLKIILVVVAPIVVFLVVGAIMAEVTGRRAALANSHPPNPTPLNMRFSYDVRDVDGFWSALGPDGRIAEQRFLQFDLIFPTFYGGALVASLLWLSMRAGWRPALAIAPVVVGAVADWTENLVQLEQLRRYSSASGASGLDPGAVQIASLATATKLVAVGVGFVMLFVLAAMIYRRTG